MIALRNRFGLAIALAGAALLGLAIYATIVEPNVLQVKRIDLTFRDLPQELDGLVIAHISDLHTHRLGRRERALLRHLDQDPPDIIAITGDLISDRSGIEVCLELLGNMVSNTGIWAVQGNWEHYADWTGEAMRQDLSSVNVSLLINEAIELAVGFWIAGTDDPSLGYDQLSGTLAGTEGGFVVLLAHSPAIIKRVPEGVDLILAGHTHGGQVRLPLIGAPWGRYIGGGYLYGIYEREGTVMYVTRGVGMTNLPVRFLCPPEIAYITLRREAG